LSNQNIYFICGVSGCGKSTIGKLLAKSLDIPFADGDDFHPTENIDKMKSGQALNDHDRKGWLESIHNYTSKDENSIVIACSALKEKYRTILTGEAKKSIHWIFLLGSFELIHERMLNRNGHFMPDALLKSQFDILEVPDYALKIDISASQQNIVEKIIEHTR